MSKTEPTPSSYGHGARIAFTERHVWKGDEIFYNGKPIWRCSADELTVLVVKQRDAYVELNEVFDEAKRQLDEANEAFRVEMRRLIDELVEYARELELELEELRGQKEEAE